MKIAHAAVAAKTLSWQGELPFVEQQNLWLLGEARVLLAGVAVLVALARLVGPEQLLVLTILAVYIGLTVQDLRSLRSDKVTAIFHVNHWIDFACYLPVAALTGGAMSPFGVFLLFPAFAACVRAGSRRGIAIAVLYGATLGVLAGIQAQIDPLAVLTDVPLAPAVLVLTAATVIARWAHTEVTLVRRLAFSADVSRIFTPQRDLRKAIFEFSEMLKSYYQADACIVVLKEPRSTGWRLFEAGRRSKAAKGDFIDEALAQSLLVIPAHLGVLFREHRLLSRAPICRQYDASTVQPVQGEECGTVAELAQLLEAKSLISLPLTSRNRTVGRLYLTSDRLTYGQADLGFLAQVLVQVGVMIENMQLVDRLATEVAHEERRKISRDLHDGTIQPYIGLKLALEALQRNVHADPMIVHEIADIIRMASDGIMHLRHYVGHLKEGPQHLQVNSLLPGIRRQADKFTDYYGIRTDVTAEGDIEVKPALFEEIMHFVREALSNIRRHTGARSAEIHVHGDGGRLRLEFRNDTGEQCAAAPFFPRSMGERARDLGGRVEVDVSAPGRTIVSVEVPL
jgi:signal transduction histidine kinase